MSDPMQSTSVMARLAWRSKWMRRWQAWKSFLLGASLVVIGVPLFVAFTPWGPAQVHKYIHEKNPEDQAVQPWATEWLYKLGYFYGLTMRDEKAMEVYNELEEWYDDPLREIPAGDRWVGCAIYQQAQILDLLHRRRIAAAAKYKRYLTEFSAEFNSDYDSNPDYDRIAQQRLAEIEGKPFTPMPQR